MPSCAPFLSDSQKVQRLQKDLDPSESFERTNFALKAKTHNYESEGKAC